MGSAVFAHAEICEDVSAAMRWAANPLWLCWQTEVYVSFCTSCFTRPLLGSVVTNNLPPHTPYLSAARAQEAAKVQEELGAAEFDGYSNDETVRVVMSGNQEPKSVDITEEAIAGGPEVLSGLCVVAVVLEISADACCSSTACDAQTFVVQHGDVAGMMHVASCVITWKHQGGALHGSIRLHRGCSSHLVQLTSSWDAHRQLLVQTDVRYGTCSTNYEARVAAQKLSMLVTEAMKDAHSKSVEVRLFLAC